MSPRPCVAMKLMASGVTNCGGHHEVALVLAVLVVDEDDHLARADVGDGAGDALGEPGIDGAAAEPCRGLELHYRPAERAT